MFPGAVPVGGAPQVAIWLTTANDDPRTIVTYDHIYQGSPPMEFLRYDQHSGVRSFTVSACRTSSPPSKTRPTTITSCSGARSHR